MILDVAEQEFQVEVIDRSAREPVVVDFWAAWCGPCRALTPALEQAAGAREGKVTLAKVDTDANPAISQSFGIQGIPAVKAFRDGQVVDEFTGALPPAQVEAFFDRLVPNEAELLVAAGDEASLRRALELQPRHRGAAIALGRILHARGEAEEALALVREHPGSFAAEGLAARIRLEGDPAHADALRAPLAALDAGEHEAALDGLIEQVAAADGEQRDDLRRVVVAALDELGADSPLARDTRRRLATALY